MPYCPNPECPHRKRLGEPAEFNKGVAKCSDCGSKLSEAVPHFDPPQKREKESLVGWKCPECGATNRDDISICACGYDSNKPFRMTSDEKGNRKTQLESTSFPDELRLTKQERKFAELSAIKYRGFFYRNSRVVGWIGVVLFTLGLLRLHFLPDDGQNTFSFRSLSLWIGFVMIMWSSFALAVSVTGKLYEYIQNKVKHDK